MANPQTGVTATSTSSTGITITWTIAEAYLYQELQYQTPYINWTTISASIKGTAETYSFIAVPNIEYMFRLRGQDATLETWSDWSDVSFPCTCALDVVSESIFFGGSSIDLLVEGTYSDTVTATITFDGFSLDAGSISTNYAHYLASSTGAVYEYSDAYEGDAGEKIPCEWQSKETNFVDQYKELEDMQKNVHFARLYYVDKTANVSTIIKLSNDGGVTWKKSVTKSIGTGDGKSKSADFFFPEGPLSGQFFTIKIENNDATSQLQWTAVGLYFDVGGEDFSVS